MKNFSQRARDWVKEAEPSTEQLFNAYQNMTQKLRREPSLKDEDAESCLEFLIEAYAEAGGDVDDLLVQETDKAHPGATGEFKLDPSPLYEVADEATPKLSGSEKRQEFLRLKERLCGKHTLAL